MASEVQTDVVQMASGERAVVVKTSLAAPPATIWRFFSTEAGLRCWAAPVVKLDLRSGGSLQTNYDKSAHIGDPGTISLRILNYFDAEFITYKVKLNDAFPAQLQNHDDNLQEVVRLQRLPDGGTQLVSSMVGWGSGADWDKAVAFFAKGNEWSYRNLVKCAEALPPGSS